MIAHELDQALGVEGKVNYLKAHHISALVEAVFVKLLM
jgi:hypothetical protein